MSDYPGYAQWLAMLREHENGIWIVLALVVIGLAWLAIARFTSEHTYQRARIGWLLIYYLSMLIALVFTR